MRLAFPEGWFGEDLLWWGNGLTSRTRVARGGLLEVPDLRASDNRSLIDLVDANRLLLASLNSDMALQLTWTVESDYVETLDRYGAEASGSRWSGHVRRVRGRYYQDRASDRSLRRERLYLFLSRPCSEIAGVTRRSVRSTRAYMAQLSSEFGLSLHAVGGLYPMARWSVFGDEGHCVTLRKALNPSLSHHVLARAGEAAIGLDRSRSVRANCLRSGINVFAQRSADGRVDVLCHDGFVHALFVLRSLPLGTRPGMLLPILGAVKDGISITTSVYPLSVDAEIERLRKEIADLSLFLKDKKSLGVENDIAARRSRIDSLLSSVTIPFNLLFIVRVWDATLDGLAAKSLAVKTALHRLDGAEFDQASNPAQAMALFYETLPGHLGSRYRGWDLYVENRNLADLLPVSASFGGRIDQPQALYDSPSGSLVGVELLAADGTPQHSVVAGVNGSGKSAFLIDLMGQTDGLWAYRFFQEEGLAFATLSRLLGMESLVLRESGERTLNPFDTFGLPLTSGAISGVVRLCMKLIGSSADDDRNKRREALIAEYVHAHFEDHVEDWKNADEARWSALGRRALLAYRSKAPNDDCLDAYAALKERAVAEPGWLEEAAASLSEEELLGFVASAKGGRWTRAIAYSQFTPAEYPQFSGLVSLMRHARQSHHRSGRVAEEIDFIASELAKGRRVGGLVGSLIDGETNLALNGRGLHFDTSFAADGLLKEVAGFVVFDRVRQYILSLPRAQPKVMLLDELRRILVIPGARDFVKEALAQMRKYRCVFIGAFQEASQIDEIDPALTDLLFGQCKQLFLLRQNNREQIERIGRLVGLPKAAQRAVASHPLIEHQRGRIKASHVTYFSREGAGSVCGTIRVELDPHTRFVANSSGKTFDERERVLARHPSAFEAVMAEAPTGEGAS